MEIMRPAVIKFTKGVHHTLTPRQLCDFECIANQSFKPLQTFLNRKDYESVIDTARLNNGAVWPMPIVLDVSSETKDELEKTGQPLILRDSQFNFLAKMDVGMRAKRKRGMESKCIYR